VSRVFRFGPGALEQLGDVATEIGVHRPILLTSRSGLAAGSGLPVVGVYAGVRSHVPAETVAEAAAVAEEANADALVALGGGSAMDTAKAVTVELLGRGREVRTIAVPTTYAGAEFTPFYGVRDEAARTKGGGSDARSPAVAAIYDPELTLTLPPGETGGTAMNAFAHCAEALYVRGRTERGDRHAFCGARAIAHALPLVLERPDVIYGRARLLEGAMRAAWALAEAGLGLGHALAQAVGGRTGLPHGALNAICLPAALRFNAEAAPDALATLGEAIGADDTVASVEELSALTGFTRLRDLGVDEGDLDELGALAAARPGAKANPRLASAEEATALLRSVW
jgi:maleylacetate reductase